MSDDALRAHADLAELTRLRTAERDLRELLAQQKRATLAEMTARLNAEADVGWWHATVANYVTSATTTDREILRDTMAEALTHLHPGAALLTELEAARALADSVTAYFNKRGWSHAIRSGNDDILAMSEALAEYGVAEQKARPQ